MEKGHPRITGAGKRKKMGYRPSTAYTIETPAIVQGDTLQISVRYGNSDHQQKTGNYTAGNSTEQHDRALSQPTLTVAEKTANLSIARHRSCL